MSKREFSVGIDVGKDELYVSVSDKQVRRFVHSRAGIRSLARWVRGLSGGLPVRYCLEATGVYSVSCAHHLHIVDKSGLISVVNPAQISAYGKAQLRRSKTDRVDAELIRSFAETQELHDWEVVSPVVLRLCQLVSQSDAVREELRRWENRRHALGFQPEVDCTVNKTQRSIERTLRRQLAALQAAIEALCKNDADLCSQVSLLCSIPGVAELSAVRLLAYGKSALTKYDRKELAAHAGLAPRQYQSGSSVRGKSRIAKQGDKRLRTALFMPALVGIVHNPILKRLYQRLLANGKPKMVALVACMRKLLLMAQAMLKKKQEFNPEMA